MCCSGEPQLRGPDPLLGRYRLNVHLEIDTGLYIADSSNDRVSFTALPPCVATTHSSLPDGCEGSNDDDGRFVVSRYHDG
jgi:hypothetical protein